MKASNPVFPILCALVSTAQAASFAERAKDAYQARAEVGFVRGASVAAYSSSTGPQAFGFGDVRSPHDRLEIGSVSKTFTGIAIAKLAVEKKLDLEAPISRYVPELEGTFAGTLTAHLLAIHTARLPDGFPGEDRADDAAFIRLLKNYAPGADYPVGVRQYSNTGFATLGLVIAKVSGRPYAEYVRATILNPLRMRESGFLARDANASFLIAPHDVLLKKTFVDTFGTAELASGGIYSSAADMAKFVRALLRPELAPTLKDAIRLAETTGFGFDSDPGAKLLWKNGGMTGYGSLLEVDPAHDQAAFAVVNSRNTLAAMGICDLTLGGVANLWGTDRVLAGDPVENAAALRGVYTAVIGGNALHLNVVPVSAGHLGLRLTTDGVDYALGHLVRIGANAFAINNGLGLNDRIEFTVADGKPAVSVVFSEFKGTGADGKPVYEKEEFARSSGN